MKKRILICATVLYTLMVGCSRDEFAKLNTDQSVVSPDISYLFTQGLLNTDLGDYPMWFYNYSRYYLIWNQATVSSAGNGDGLNKPSAFYSQQSLLNKVKNQFEGVKYEISLLPSDKAIAYKYIDAICTPLCVFAALFGTDSYGSMAYEDAGKLYFWQEPQYLTPAYSTQQDLLYLWLNQIDESIDVLSNKVYDDKGNQVPQISLGAQDFVYKGDVSKWLKFANSLKLKIAVRLLNVDKATSIAIAEEVVNSSVGIMASSTDDFLWNPGSQYYHFGNDVTFGPGSKTVIDFLVQNKDPRVRFLFAKNDFNSTIVSEFIEEGVQLPFYIDQYVEYITDENGKKEFAGWKTLGEPWVRYHGAPIEIEAKNDSVMLNSYFSSSYYKLTVDGKSKSYNPSSTYQEEMIRGGVTYVYPSLPNVTPVQDNIAQPYYAVFLSSAEVNLYLAEFKLLGANLPQTAQFYYQAAVESSVKMLDNLASLNRIPYYGESNSAYTSPDENIALKSGEIDSLLQQPAYQLTGSLDEQLEKVYIQQYLHFLYSPNDQYVTVRRSGVPRTGSNILPRVAFSSIQNITIPRRLPVNAINPADVMKTILENAYREEGFTPGSTDPMILSTERVWYDKSAPNYGTGPQY